ncbi:hypothetical protein SISNIDRAFT_465871 [Sistotremastrum niveocremeum HHB9708]|uniref:Uncharacterized protein n=1 Tax=Sistotremastrum niveocremeum HHB9708 TaxID=1314777 RepID=A0A164V045_9AGAM|nr:hypothetical protein SISNIDRAFT_465871 [Sistotremastrum niveocremeum HHB9708]
MDTTLPPITASTPTTAPTTQPSAATAQTSPKPQGVKDIKKWKHLETFCEQVYSPNIQDDFVPGPFNLPRDIQRVVFNCHPDPRAKETPPDDFVCPWKEIDTSIATNKALEFSGDAEIGFLSAAHAERYCCSKLQHEHFHGKECTCCLVRNVSLAYLAVRLGLLNCPDFRASRNDQYKICQWLKAMENQPPQSKSEPDDPPPLSETETDNPPPLSKAKRGQPPLLSKREFNICLILYPKALANLVEALGGGIRLAWGYKALEEWLNPYLYYFGPKAARPDLAANTDQKDPNPLKDVKPQYDGCVNKLIGLIKFMNDTPPSLQTPCLQELGQVLNASVRMTSHMAGERIKVDANGRISPFFAQLGRCGADLFKRSLWDGFMYDPRRRGMYLKKGGEHYVPYVSAMTDVVMSPAVLAALAMEQDLCDLVEFDEGLTITVEIVSDIMVASVGCFQRQYRHNLEALEPYMVRIVEASNVVLRDELVLKVVFALESGNRILALCLFKLQGQSFPRIALLD